MVADTIQEKSMISLIEWKKVVLENADYLGEDYRIPFIILENKVDLLQNQFDSHEAFLEMMKKKKSKLDEFALANGIDQAFLTSAKENINLEEAFMSLSEKILAQLEGKNKKEKDTNFSSSFKNNNEVVLGTPMKEEKKCC
jgi:hypothetical protein